MGVEVPNLETTSVVAFHSSYSFYDLFEKLLLLQIDKPKTYLYNLSNGMHPEYKLGAMNEVIMNTLLKSLSKYNVTI